MGVRTNMSFLFVLLLTVFVIDNDDRIFPVDNNHEVVETQYHEYQDWDHEYQDLE